MSVLAVPQAVRIIRAAVLARIAPDVLSDFERELVRDVSRRLADYGLAAAVTDAEWQILDDVIEAAAAAFAADPERVAA